ncbi:hypothetical protein ACFSM5_04350 [Lacibacterium aquatile]|uniref:Uncharacterized protein n=1 Tax=Lacibacterium aquatile TaxID=1168082 RepID=A0ABW5DNN1_9PROT
MEYWTQTGLSRTRDLARSGMDTPPFRPRFSIARIFAGWWQRLFNC